MTTIADIRNALAAAVESTGLSCDPYVRMQVNAPQAMVNRMAMSPQMVLGGSKSQYAFRVTLYVNLTQEIEAQQALDNYCMLSSDTSIVDAIEGYNWSGIADYGEVTQVGETTVQDVGGVSYLTVDFDLIIVF